MKLKAIVAKVCGWVTGAAWLLLPASGLAAVDLFVDTTRPAGAVDLTRYSLGQGGLSDQPMFDAQADQIALLKPPTIRLFVQEYFNLCPAPGQYHWETLDRSIENILATGAKPILSLCFKPAVFYPRIDHDVVEPNDYAGWEKLVFELVRHCNQVRRYGIEYWEIGNEVDIGESGGCPYRFQPAAYTNYYARTVGAILRADPAVKVGGPALASHQSPIGDALIDFCGSGGAPLHFFSWHLYADSPGSFRQTIRAVKRKLARHPRLQSTETLIDEWNIALIRPEPRTGFQAAFVLENTLGFFEEGLSRAAYYHIRDYYVDPAKFQWMSSDGLKFMADWWNVKPQNSGLFDNQGRRRPAWFAFQMLSHLKGQRLEVTSSTNLVRALAVRNGGTTHVVFWNFSPPGAGGTNEVIIRLPPNQAGSFRLAQLDAAANRLETLRLGAAAELEGKPLRVQLPPCGVGWLQVGEFKVRASWGHRSAPATPFQVRITPGSPTVRVREARGYVLEADEGLRGDTWQSRAGGGDVDGVEFTLALASGDAGAVRQEQTIWTYLLKESDPDTAQRLRDDPAFRTDPPLLTVQMNPEGTKGFSVSVDQLFQNECLWVPGLDMFLSLGEPFTGFEVGQRALAPLAGKRILDRVRTEPEATREQFTSRWEDMGNPSYRNPAATPPGHIVGVSWDSAIPKFGIDRKGGVWSDLGNPDRFQFSLDIAGAAWQGQRLTGGLPVLVTTWQGDSMRGEVEQFAYPLRGPPTERRGDIDMVLLGRVVLTNVNDTPRTVQLRFRHSRDFPSPGGARITATNIDGTTLFVDTVSDRCLFSVDGPAGGISLAQSAGATDTNRNTVSCRLDATVSVTLPAGGTATLLVKLPSPMTGSTTQAALRQTDHAAARAATLKFWSDHLERGALFRVPEEAVNDLFRANLWHALRLPRRHGGSAAGTALDLPYSNFAYGQRGTPWPVNQAVYVDYMLYDLRGYHDLSREELLAMYHNNQEPNGHVGGFANWGVYTPGMLYSVAQHYLLSRDRASFEQLLPPTLKALDWCLAELNRAAQTPGSSSGLVLAPLNDLSHEQQAWAFNQAYLFAGLDLLGRALAEIRHPRAGECQAAAQTLRQAIGRAFGHATMAAPLVQLRDHTWSPYVPADALTPRRLLEVWYPTDVDSGALHLARLKALDPSGPLTTCLLNDHEDNLFLKGWGMANEPVYNQQATAYLLRDEPKAAIRAFYSMMACAFSHAAFEPVEHRWAWGQYFGPPSTDGAWFELYRRMLIHERDDGSLLLAQATPRAWLQDGKRIEVRHAPTYYGPLSMLIESRAAAGQIRATVDLGGSRRPETLLVRLRHPAEERIERVRVNGRDWRDFDAEREWVRLPQPREDHLLVEAYYGHAAGQAGGGASNHAPNAVESLATEVRTNGWIAYGARSEKGDWDLFLCRPDGSERRNLTSTPDYNEFSPLFSRDGQRLLYRRLPRTEMIDNNNHGTQGELVLANSDGREPRAFGRPGEYPWASWGPDGRQIATLSIKGISFVDLASRQTVRTLPRKGFFQQMTWSPDGQWLSGVANSYGTGWSIARMAVATGEVNAANRVDCCTPDWFPNNRQIIFSWRPPGQKANNGYGWTQLWMAAGEGTTRRLLYAEDGRHVYGGHVSPDGNYALFTGNMEEDGDPAHGGGPMGLIRVEDAPIIGGESKDVRAVHPEAKDGPVLILPAGWEPCWTAFEIGSNRLAAAVTTKPEAGLAVTANRSDETPEAVDALARELHEEGWLVFSARTERGDWDLSLMRPDGTDRRKITDTPGFNEAGARFSPDGKRLLYYRMPREEPVDNNTYGTFDLVIADADGRKAVVYGRDYPWAAWGPDGSQLACLSPQRIRILDVASRRIVRQIPRQGLVQQLGWSPDGKWFTGTANGLGPFWSIGRLDAQTGQRNAVSEVDRYNCTPDWFPDSQHIVYSRGIIPQQGGRAELWLASGDGRERSVLYAEESRHLYGGCASPDGRFVLFTRSVEDLGKVDNSRTSMAIIRRSDAPMIGEPSDALRRRLPQARRGPRLDLGPGWEPHWTRGAVGATSEGKTP
jgi:Tol biopolymer transport system component